MPESVDTQSVETQSVDGTRSNDHRGSTDQGEGQLEMSPRRPRDTTGEGWEKGEAGNRAGRDGRS